MECHWQNHGRAFKKVLGWIDARTTDTTGCVPIIPGGQGGCPLGNGPRALAAAEEVVPPPEDKIAVRQFDGEGVAVTPPLHLRWPRLPVFGVGLFICLSEIGAENKVSKNPRS